MKIKRHFSFESIQEHEERLEKPRFKIKLDHIKLQAHRHVKTSFKQDFGAELT
jgi:hypothetical protein